MTRGPLIIVSGPSGSGKSTLIKAVLNRHPGRLRLAVSATTRPRRPGEEEGKDYYFWTPEQFKRGLDEGAFLEHAHVHGAHCYGTLGSEVGPWRDRGVGVFLDVDVQGAANLRPLFPDHVSVFITLPSPDVYRQRLLGRHSETPESIERRMKTMEQELLHQGEYGHVIVNDDLERAVAELDALVIRTLARAKPE
jgi:guanylate kinase